MQNRIAIITGAGSGIGRAAALRLAGSGIKLVLNGRDKKKLADLEAQINKPGQEKCCCVVSGNIADPGVIEACLAACWNTWHKPPCVFLAAAGRGLPGNVITSDAGQWDDLINTNIIGLLNQLRSVGNSMLEQAAATRDFVQHPLDIVVIGSSIGRNVSPFNSVYGATKFAAHGLTEALRRQLGPHGIRVTLVEPGLVSTNFQQAAGYDMQWFRQYEKEVGPILTSDDVAQVIQFVLQLPGNVHLDNISVRPTRQAYP